MSFDSDDSPTKRFNVDKYTEQDGRVGQGGYLKAPIAPYVDAADALANMQQMVVSFKHDASGKEVFFKAFIMALNETYNSDWASESVFGRVDPIKLFRSTERKITLALKVPAATESEAYENLGRVQMLTQFLYPTYVGSNGRDAQLLGQAPLVRLKVMNLIQKNSAGPGNPQGDLAGRAAFSSYKTDLTPSNGVLGAINNVQINHNLENNEANVIQKGPNTILPTYIDIAIDFSPIHEHRVGWNEEGEALTATFPYGVDLHTEKQKIDQEDIFGGGGLSVPPDPGCADAKTPAKAKKCKEQYNDKVDEYGAMGELVEENFGDRDSAQQAIDNAKSRYDGMFGNARFNRDKRRYMKGKDIGSRRESALAGETASRDRGVRGRTGLIYDLEY